MGWVSAQKDAVFFLVGRCLLGRDHGLRLLFVVLLRGLRGLRAATLHLPRGDHAGKKEHPEDEQPEVHPQRRVVPVSIVKKLSFATFSTNAIAAVVGVERRPDQQRTSRTI